MEFGSLLMKPASTGDEAVDELRGGPQLTARSTLNLLMVNED